MRQFIFFLLLLLLPASVYADSFNVVHDFNYEVESSNSREDTIQIRKTAYVAGKVYFIAKTNGDAITGTFHYTSEHRLVVTNGTKQGTQFVKGLDNIDVSAKVKALEVVNGKAVVLLRADDGYQTELWEIDPINDTATKVGDYSRANGYPEIINEALTYHYGDTKLVITADNASSMIIYDSVTRVSSVINLEQLMQSAHHTPGKNNYVLGDYFYYEVSDSSGDAIYRLNLNTQESEFYEYSTIGKKHIVVDDKVYFFRRVENDVHDILSITNEIGSTKIEFSDASLVYLDNNSAIKNLDEKLVYTYSNFILAKNKSGGQFIRLELPEKIRFYSNDSGYVSEFVLYKGKYYTIAINYDKGLPVLLETDLASYVSVVGEQDKASRELKVRWKHLGLKNGSLYLIADKEVKSSDHYGSFGESFGYLWDIENQVFNKIWTKTNFTRVEPINSNDKEIVFAYSVEDGIEPWRLDISLGETTQLANLNKNLATRDTSFSLAFATATRAVFNTAYFAFNPAFNYLSFDGTELKPYIKPDTHPTFPGDEDTLVGIDKKYDYFTSTRLGDGLPKLVITGFDYIRGELVELDAFTRTGISNQPNSKMTRGYLNFIHKDCSSICTPNKLIRWGVDGTIQFNIDEVYEQVFADGETTILTAFDEESQQQRYGIVKDNKIIKQFSITSCETKFSCRLEFSQIIDNGSTLLISVNNDKQLYHISISSNEEPQQIPVNLFENDRFPYPGPVLAMNDKAILFYREELLGRTTIFRYNLSDGTSTAYPDSPNIVAHVPSQVSNLLKKVGNYYVLPTINGFVLFDKSLKLVKRKSNQDIYQELGLNPDYLRRISFWGCSYGYCYVQYTYRDNNTNSKIQIKFDVSFDNLSVEYHDILIWEKLWGAKNKSYVRAETALYGIELYQYETTGIDTDGDGMTDGYELAFDFDPYDSSDAQQDSDGDNLSNVEEFQLGTDPTDVHTDDDEVEDGLEVNLGFDPREYDTHLHDTDGDGLSYRRELMAGTDYSNPDTDGDGVNDFVDLFPLDKSETADFDLDGIGDNADTDDDNDGVEDSEDVFPYNQDEWADNDLDGIGDNNDTDDDNDLMPDEWELQYGLNPLSGGDRDLDPDNDGRTNYQEYLDGTDPTVSNKNDSGGGSPTDGGGSSGGGGGSAPLWLLLILLLTSSVRRYYK